MRHLFGAAILAASFLIAVSAEAQTRPARAPDQVIALDGPASTKPYPGALARQRSRRYVRQVHPRARFNDLYGFPRHYPAQHELPPIFYGSVTGL